MLHRFTAKVVAGKGRGRRLGFPTANLDKTDLKIDQGVYLVEAEINKKMYNGLLHFGFRKTFNEEVSLELYIKDFDFDIYGRDVKIKIIRKIRAVRKFANAENLKKQIAMDIEKLKGTRSD